MGGPPNGGPSLHWPFGPLTEPQIRARIRFEAAMRAGRLAMPLGALL